MQTNNNTIAVEQIVRNLVDAWNRHNAKDFAALFAEDSEFTTVVGQRIEGPVEIERVHSIGFSTVLKEATLTIKDVHVRWIRSDIAAIDLRWDSVGNKTPDGKPVPPRNGFMTLLIATENDAWHVVVGHNLDYTATYKRGD